MLGANTLLVMSREGGCRNTRVSPYGFVSSLRSPLPCSPVEGGRVTAILVEPIAREDRSAAFFGLRVRLTQGGEGLVCSVHGLGVGNRWRRWRRWRRERRGWAHHAQAQGQGRASRTRKWFQELPGRDRAGRERGHLTQDWTRGLVVESVVE